MKLRARVLRQQAAVASLDQIDARLTALSSYIAEVRIELGQTKSTPDQVAAQKVALRANGALAQTERTIVLVLEEIRGLLAQYQIE